MHRTLRGVFSEPKPPPRRNFLRENVLRIKKIQKPAEQSKSNEALNGSASGDRKPSFVTTVKSNKDYQAKQSFQGVTRKQCCKRGTEKARNDGLSRSVESLRPASSASTLRDQGIQTDDVNDEFFLKDTMIRYPSNLSSDHEDEHDHHHHQPHHHHHRSVEPPQSSFRKEGSNLSSAKSVSIKTPSEDGEFPVKRVEKKQQQKTPETPEPVRRFVKGQCKVPPPDQKLDIPANYKMGEVPKYLKEIKDELAKLAHPEPEDACCPEGHILLPDEDRLNTLDIAKKRFEALIKELNKLPMTSETLRVRQRKIDIEKELIKLEDSIRIFSRAKVYVKLTE